MTTLIIGATGLFGSRLCTLLSRRGVHVLAMTRDPECAARLTTGNITGVVADLDDPESLREPMQQADRVFLTSPMHPDLGRRECAAIEMAQECGVEQVVKIMGAVRHENDLIHSEHLKALAALESSDLMWTIVSPQTVMETNLIGQVDGIVFTDTMYGSAGNGRIGMVAADDCAEAAAAVLASAPEVLHQRNLEITGPEALTYGEIATELSIALQRNINYVDMPEDEFREFLLTFGMPEEDIDLQVLCHFRAMRAGNAGIVTNTFEWLTGQKPKTIAQWARAHKNIFTHETAAVAAG